MRPREVHAPAALRGELRLPSDKSIGHRALMVAALADGECNVMLHLPGEDLESTRRCLAALGSDGTLDCGNSGTTMRLLAGLLVGQGLAGTLDGDASLRSRPMERVAEPLRRMGAHIETTDGHAPLRVAAAQPRTARHVLEVASAQTLELGGVVPV